MTPLWLWVAVATVALISTATWAVLARQTGVYVTSGLSFTAWAWCAIVGGDTAMVATGTETALLWMRQTAASLQYVMLALAIISLVVFSLRLLGAYPSPRDNAAETSG